MRIPFPLFAAFLLAACGQSPGAPESAEPAPAHDEASVELPVAELEPAGIRIETLRAVTTAGQIEATATVRPNLEKVAHVAPRLDARIASVHAQLGDQVRAGQVLAILDSVEVGDAHSAWLQTRSELELARTAFERAESLHAEQIVSQKDHLRARADYERARAAYRAAEDRLRLFGVELDPRSDGKAVSTFPLRSTFAGTVTEKHAIVGELATPQNPAFTVADLSLLWVEANLNERDIGLVRKGAPAEVRVAAYPDTAFRGTVAYIGDVLDKETRTVPVRVEVRNGERRLKPEMFATVLIDAVLIDAARIEGNAGTNPITLPADAVVLVDGKSTVFVPEASPAEPGQAHFEAREVRVGPERRGRVAVLEGLAPGERAVVAGAYELKARLLKSKLGEGHAH
jgi:cobalt-zinc-cadmium efflux system membrane fusion protein